MNLTGQTDAETTQVLDPIYNDGINVRIVCLTAQQAAYRARCESLYMRMTFKRAIEKGYEAAFTTKEETLRQCW